MQLSSAAIEAEFRFLLLPSPFFGVYVRAKQNRTARKCKEVVRAGCGMSVGVKNKAV